MAEKVNVQRNIPRIYSKRIRRQSVLVDSNRKDKVESYYFRNVAIPFLNNVCVDVLTVCSHLMYLVFILPTLDKNFYTEYSWGIDWKC